MAPKIVDKEKRKHELALIALKLFSEEGYELTSISRVAKVAGIGKGTVYEYFTSKEELFHESLIAWVEEFSSDVQELIDNTENPKQRLENYIKTMINSFMSDTLSIKMLLHSFQYIMKDDASKESREFYKRLFASIRKMITGIILDGVSQGIFSRETARNAETIAINLAAYLDGIAIHHLLSNGYFDLNDQIEHYLSHLFAGICVIG